MIIAGSGRGSGRFRLDDGGDASGVGLPPNILGVGQLVVLLVLHPAVLEPNLYLSLGQAEGVCNFNPPSPSQVAIEVELLE